MSISSHSHTNETLSYTPFSNVSPWTEIKGTKFDEVRGHSDTHVYDDIITEDMFSSRDVVITYFDYGNRLEELCSFSLSEKIEEDKYDFVTIVLRDLLRSFGIVWTAKNVRDGELRINENNLIPFKWLCSCFNH